MQSRTYFGISVFIALLALAGGAAARGPFAGPPPGARGGDPHDRFLEKYADRLGIDDETGSAIEQQFEASRAQAEPIREALHEEHRALREMLREAEPDRTAILNQADTVGELETELRKLRLTTLLEVRGMLSAEQRTELMSIHDERMQSGVQPMMEACADDVDALCPDVEDPRSLIHCMRENREALSEGCRDSIAKGHHRRGGSGCREDHARDWPEE